MMEDPLNDPNNLNPEIPGELTGQPNNSNQEELSDTEKVKQAVTEEEKLKFKKWPSKQVIEEQRVEQIDKWNEDPAVKRQKVKAVDLNKERSIGRRKYGFLLFLAIIGSLVIIGTIGITGYTIYKDGTLKSPINMICAPSINVTSANLACPQITLPACPACPSNNFSCPTPIVNNYFNGTT